MAENRILRAGPLELEFRAGDLWHIRLGGKDLVERIYVALRDRNWGTVPGRIENLSIEERGSGFTAVFDCVHQSGLIDFIWRGTVIGAADGGISFAMDGRARTSFLRNRIGFCVHHPLAACAGRPCTIEGPDGRIRKASFPDLVAPHQPFLGIRAMSYEAAPGAELQIRFHGEVFETEDHRNWTDANFKTYGTPLELPFPVEVPAGSRISQMVELKLRGPAAPARPAPAGPIEVRELSGPALPLPEIGLCLGGSLSPGEAGLLKRLRLGHVRVDLDLDGDWRPILERAIEQAALLGVKLEAAVTLPGDPSPLARWKPQVKRWLVFRRGERVSSAATILAARRALGRDALLVTGTNAYFAELNRNRPAAGDWDAACFSANPQVHAFDDESVMANTEGQYHAVRTARSFLGGKPVLVSPVTLRPRFNPNATSAAAAPPPDPRQSQPFCAAWTAGSLRSLALAGASSVTYFETRGPAGVLDGDRTYPVYDVLAAAGEFAGGSLLPCESSDPGRLGVLLVATGTRRRLLIANRTPAPLRAAVRGGSIELAGWEVRNIDWQAG